MATTPATSFDEAKIRKDAEVLANRMNKAIDTVYAPGLADMEFQKSQIPGEFNVYRNAADLQARVDAQTLNERMANMGLTSSGTNLTAQTAIDVSNQNVHSQINTAEAKAVQEIRRKIAAYIAERDAKKQETLATAMGRAEDTINQFMIAKSSAELNHYYNTLQQEQNHKYTLELRKVDEQIMIAKENRDYQKEKELTQMRHNLEKERQAQAAQLNYQYSRKLAIEKAKTKTNVKTSLDTNERNTIDALTNSILANPANGESVTYKDVAKIAAQYPPGTIEYNYAMANIGMPGASVAYGLSAQNAVSGSPTSSASAYGLGLYGQDTSAQNVITAVRAKYKPGTDNYNAALIAAGYGQYVTGAEGKSYGPETWLSDYKGFGR